MTDRGFPSARIAIINKETGVATQAFWRVLEALWRRVGGFDDILSGLEGADGSLLALISALEGESIDSKRFAESLVARQSVLSQLSDVQCQLDDINKKIEESCRKGPSSDCDDRCDELSREVETLRALLSGIETEPDAAAAAGGGGGAVTSVFGRTGAVVAAASDYDADQVDYDNATSGLTATEVQAAIDEVDGKTGGGGTGTTAWWFSPPLLATFSTAVTAGTVNSTATSDDTDVGMTIFGAPSAGSHGFMRLKTSLALPFIASAKVLLGGSRNAQSRSGFVIRNSTTGQRLVFGLGGTNDNLAARQMTGTTFNSETNSLNRTIGEPVWLRFDVDASGNVDLYHSVDGKLWHLWIARTAAQAVGAGLDQIGFSVEASTGTETVSCVAQYYVDA